MILGFRRVWPSGIRKGDFEPPALTDITGLERVSWNAKKGPIRETILSWSNGMPVWGLSQGDFNRDGHLDLVYALANPAGLRFLLGDGKGGFRTAEAEGIEIPNRNLYDIKVADLDRDGNADILLMFEKGDTDRTVRCASGSERAAGVVAPGRACSIMRLLGPGNFMVVSHKNPIFLLTCPVDMA